jgi:hypothetical protein
MSDQWPQDLPVVQVRVARPTDRLEAVVRFYHEGLELQEMGEAGHHLRGSGWLAHRVDEYAWHLSNGWQHSGA